MPTFRTRLQSGNKPPYDRWTFAVVPDAIRRDLGGKARIEVTVELAGTRFRTTIAKGEGVYRLPVAQAVRQAAGVQNGDRVELTVTTASEPHEAAVPAELGAVLDRERLWDAFAALMPSQRRAWCQHVGDAKRPETRARRASTAPAGIRARAFPGQR